MQLIDFEGETENSRRVSAGVMAEDTRFELVRA